jgi:hypothetical protein
MRKMKITTARSSTSVIPTATRPCRACSSPRSRRSRTSTSVLAVETIMPTMSAGIR